MFYYRPAEERGKTRLGWLQSRHSFSFGYYYDPEHMGFSDLKVINDDWVSPGAGFDNHAHRDMEIVSYILSGAIEHRDNLGNHFVVSAGEVQRMTAGTGIVHSEFNASKQEPLRFLQVWITPDRLGLPPGYEQKSVEQTSVMTPLVTPDGSEGSLRIHQNVRIYRLQLSPSEAWQLDGRGRSGYLHIIEGGLHGSEYQLTAGAGLGMSEEVLQLCAGEEGVVALWFQWLGV